MPIAHTERRALTVPAGGNLLPSRSRSLQRSEWYCRRSRCPVWTVRTAANAGPGMG